MVFVFSEIPTVMKESQQNSKIFAAYKTWRYSCQAIVDRRCLTSEGDDTSQEAISYGHQRNTYNKQGAKRYSTTHIWHHAISAQWCVGQARRYKPPSSGGETRQNRRWFRAWLPVLALLCEKQSLISTGRHQRHVDRSRDLQVLEPSAMGNDERVS